MAATIPVEGSERERNIYSTAHDSRYRVRFHTVADIAFMVRKRAALGRGAHLCQVKVVVTEGGYSVDTKGLATHAAPERISGLHASRRPRWDLGRGRSRSHGDTQTIWAVVGDVASSPGSCARRRSGSAAGRRPGDDGRSSTMDLKDVAWHGRLSCTGKVN